MDARSAGVLLKRSLSMALRSIADNRAELERSIASGDVKVPEGDPKAEGHMLLSVEGKPMDTDTTFTVGGEVSRYQRKTIPAKAGDASAAL